MSPLLADLHAAAPVLWTNPERRGVILPADAPVDAHGLPSIGVGAMEQAAARFRRFAPLLADCFPELAREGGAIESPLLRIPSLQQPLGLAPDAGRLWVKADHGLPIAGSIKARGGIHEVLEFAERIALDHGLLDSPEDDFRKLGQGPARAVFARHQVAVGSTGNLGMSIGIIGSALGFRATVHMSADAKQWKKDRLRARGVDVVEHEGDYEKAVASGRERAALDPRCHFVDDERSTSLFVGYAAAAFALREQLREHRIEPDARRPLFVYLPCGVGGAPGGITFGLRHLLGAHVHCFFAEPVQSPCFLLQMRDPDGHPSVYDFGLTNRTDADGLAVPRASRLASELMRPLLSGVFTVTDDTLHRHLYLASTREGLRLEPSAAAGFEGPRMLCDSEEGRRYLHAQGIEDSMAQATHLVWTTGGLFVPDAEFDRFLQRGARVSQNCSTGKPT